MVKLTERDVDDIRRLLTLLEANSANDDRSGVESRNGKGQLLIHKAREILANRRRRIRCFGKAMFGETAWEMLLLLYVSDHYSRQTISRLGELAGASKSTALRWMDYLENRQLVRREAHPTDRRAAFVELTARGRETLERYLSETVASDG